MMDDTRVFSDPPLIAARLGAMDLLPAILAEAVQHGVSHAFDCTLNDPPNLAGLLIWGKTMRSLRDQLVVREWTRGNERNYATVIHPIGDFAIAVAAGDAHTGIAEEIPSTRSETGPATRDAVHRNQLSFAEFLDSFPSVVDTPPKHTWLLLHYVDEENEETRLELSLPASMTNEGYVSIWAERIVLAPIPFGGRPSTDDQVVDDAIDVRVERRAN